MKSKKKKPTKPGYYQYHRRIFSDQEWIIVHVYLARGDCLKVRYFGTPHHEYLSDLNNEWGVKVEMPNG